MLNKKEFKDIYDENFDSVRKFVYYRCGDMEMALDVAQDVFMKVWEKRTFLSGKDIKLLLYKIATGICTDSYRRKMRFLTVEQSISTTHAEASSPEDEMIFRELVAAYTEALEQMMEKQKTVFLMSRDDGMTYSKIAENLRISVKSVEKYMSGALKSLKKKLLYNRHG